VDEVELSVRRNTVHALVGPNGSGKTTLLNVLSGIYKPTNGRLFFDGQAVTRLLPHERAGRGIGRTFQNVRLFTATRRANATEEKIDQNIDVLIAFLNFRKSADGSSSSLAPSVFAGVFHPQWIINSEEVPHPWR
jgi:ABC-type branched-subunit amino acid transport system ATPase component